MVKYKKSAYTMDDIKNKERIRRKQFVIEFLFEQKMQILAAEITRITYTIAFLVVQYTRTVAR